MKQIFMDILTVIVTFALMVIGFWAFMAIFDL